MKWGERLPRFVHVKRESCRVCDGRDLVKFLELGPQPLANAFLPPEPTAWKGEEKFPLDLYWCRACHHVQLLDVVSKETLFSHYLYFSTTSRTIPAHFADLAGDVRRRFLEKGDMVVEIGSNDGVLLSAFEGTGVRALGVEPASNVAAVARKRGVQTMNAFFTTETAARIHRDFGPAKAVLGNNVVGHIDDLADLVRAVASLLSPGGVFVFEVPYLVDLLEKNEFDTVYHEHLSYFAVRPAERMLARGGLTLVDVERQNVHGGTIRLFARLASENPPKSAAVAELVALEKGLGLDTIAPYERFAERVEALRAELLAKLRDLKSQGKRIAGYGAPAKGNTLLNFCGIGPDLLDYIQDTTPAKQGLVTPGTHVPVVPPARFQERPPDAALLLAWNYETEILAKEAKFREGGGKFVVPIPSPVVK